ncbi:MAG TPA: lipopolysaccharide kinase InaA family protein [Phycisphaerae bacterium]|nr:lipopolysaccharide kinase InaA family protein [Phycisphaerae bacterium]HPS53725.1 lipopolysaccharide kinase InaA family protein [Phycisphaerae bacterium]
MKESPLAPAIVDFIRKHRLDTLDGAFSFSDGSDMVKPGLGRRRRTRVEFHDDDGRGWILFIKRYEAPSFWRRLCRLAAFRRHWCEAKNEFDNICAVRQADVPTMRAVICGAHLGFWGVGRNFIVVTAVPGQSLEKSGDAFFEKYQQNHDMLDSFNRQILRLVKTFHAAGFVHRDLYASHIFMHEHDGLLELNLIDMARVFRPVRRKFRWRVKDLAQLKYSMPAFWVEKYFNRFLEAYLGTSVPKVMKRWQRAIDRRVASMARRAERKRTESVK